MQVAGLGPGRALLQGAPLRCSQPMVCQSEAKLSVQGATPTQAACPFSRVPHEAGHSSRPQVCDRDHPSLPLHGADVSRFGGQFWKLRVRQGR